ncbi:MAG TPA: type IV pilus assembly protein PilM [Candidatus Paceibacterota bacterium]
MKKPVMVRAFWWTWLSILGKFTYNGVIMSSVFTAPKFLSMPAVGFDVSTDALRFMELEEKKGVLAVSRFGSRNFPIGIIAEGHIRDKKKLQEEISVLARDHHLSFANVALPEEQGYLANMHIPYVSPKELRGAIELQLEEYVPISAADAIFDYVVVNEAANKRKDTLDVVVSVLPRLVVEEYLEVFRGTGVIPKAFEFESQAMARAIVPRGDNGTFLVADIGKTETDVFVVANGVVQFSAILDVGGHHITQAIEKAMGISYDEAEALKTKYGLVGGEKEAALHTAMLPTMADLRTRFLRHYTYWQTHHAEKVGGTIECIYLTGGGANLKGVEEYLSAELDVKVVGANPWANVCSFESFVPPLTLRQSHGFTAAIGLALRSIFVM